MTEEETKTFFGKLSSLFEKEELNPPIKGGLLRKYCKCGGIIHEGVGRGILRDVCSKCGEIHHDRIFR